MQIGIDECSRCRTRAARNARCHLQAIAALCHSIFNFIFARVIGAVRGAEFGFIRNNLFHAVDISPRYGKPDSANSHVTWAVSLQGDALLFHIPRHRQSALQG